MKMIEKLLAHPLITLLAPITAVLFSIKTALIFLLFLIIVDLYYGIRKSFKKENISFNPLKRVFWKTVNSKGLRCTWRKSTEYGLGIIVTAFFQALFFPTFTITILGGSFTILLFVIMAACLIEIYSIFENLNEINPDNGINRIFQFIQKYFKSYVLEVINRIKGGK